MEKIDEKSESFGEKINHSFWTTWIPFGLTALFILGLIALVIWGAFRLFPNADKDSERWNFIATNTLSACALAVIINQAIIYFRQWKVMDEALGKTQAAINQADRHFQAVNRPSLGVEDVEWDKDDRNHGMKAGKFWRVNVYIKNFGNAPAIKIRGHATLEFRPFTPVSEPCAPPFVNHANGRQSVATQPSQARRRLSPMTDPLTQNDIDEFKKGLKHCMLWVHITYEGLTGARYLVKYHARFNRIGFEECDIHNDAD